MYEFNTRTRYSEYDEYGRMRLSSLLDYLQNTSSYHSFDSGMSVEYYRQLHRAWLISYWDIHIEALPADSAYITMGTSPHDIKGLFAYRNFWLRDSNTDTYYVKADSAWFIVDTDTMKPIKPSQDDLAPFGEYADVLKLQSGTRKLRFDNADNFSHVSDIPVTRAMLDTNHHVNNIRYISAAYEALTERGFIDSSTLPQRIRVEYKHAATLGDTMQIYAQRSTHDKLGSQTENDAAANNHKATADKSATGDATQIALSPAHDGALSAPQATNTIWITLRAFDGTEYCNIEFQY